MAAYYGNNGHMDFGGNSFGGGGGAQYMNFEAMNALRAKSRTFTARQNPIQKKQNFGRVQNRSPLTKGKQSEKKGREVANKPIQVDSDNVVTFYGQKHYLSSFYEAPMLIAGHLYPTVEHYYEACKVYAVGGPENAMYLKDARDPRQAKQISKKIIMSNNIPKKDVEQWKKSDGLLVMRVGMMEKFRQNPRLRNQLFKTADKMLVQCNQYDTLWSTGMDNKDFDGWLKEHKGETLEVPALIESYTLKNVPEIGKGKNLLGFILMYVRDCLKTEYGIVSGASTSNGTKMET